MARSRAPAVPSPLLSVEQVEDLLADELLEDSWFRYSRNPLGRELTRAALRRRRLDGAHWTGQIERAEAKLARVRAGFGQALHLWEWTETRPDGSPAVMLIAVVRAGRWAANPCVVQVIWTEGELDLTVHAKEALRTQHTCELALGALTRMVG